MNEQKVGLGRRITFLVIGISVLIFLFSVCLAVIKIKGSLMDSSESKISEVTEIAYNIIEGYRNKAANGELTIDKAKELATQDIRNFQYQGKNYVWVNSYDNKFIVHPTKPAGFDCTTLKDKNGKQFVVELTEIAKSGKVDFVKYEWPKPGQPQDKTFPKLATARAIPEWGWVLGTGIYIDEINSKVIQLVLQIFIGNLIVVLVIIALVQLKFVKNINKSMNEITEDLTASSRQISEASYHLETSSQRMAEGSTEQASSIQEISATLEETTSMLQNNNVNTDQAAILARQAKENADKSYREMEQMMKSMNEIKHSSNEISKIIKVIDEIAFQTNILALNAAVEAARAGDAGKGFAVVAEEVRNLAQRSTQSAKDTTELIENNISLSEQGAGLAEAVHGSIAGIDSQAKKVSELLDEISAATNEQAIGVEQIHKAISQMEQVMQASVQTADDTASASQELFAQTSAMNDVVDRIATIVNGYSVEKSTQVNYKRPTLTKKPKYDTKLISDNLSDF